MTGSSGSRRTFRPARNGTAELMFAKRRMMEKFGFVSTPMQRTANFGAKKEQLPAHEDQPFDRDRFLPDAPIPREFHSGEFPPDDAEFGDDSEDVEDDPLGLEKVDREIAAAKENVSKEP